MIDQIVEGSENDLVVQARGIVGTCLTRVEYYFDDAHPYRSLGDLCDICDYRIGIETSEEMRCKILNVNWFDGNEGGIYLDRGYLEEDFPNGPYPPLRRELVSNAPKWAPYIGKEISRVNFFSQVQLVFSTGWTADASEFLDNPKDMELVMDSSTSLHFLSGIFSPDLGFQRTESSFIIVCLGDQAKQKVLAQLV